MIVHAAIPLPLQIVIDDVGWWSGRDGHTDNEPYRTGISRGHGIADYEAIAALGRRLSMRPQAAMVLAEWDRSGTLRSVPTATWMGDRWRNPHENASMEAARDVLVSNKHHIEFAMHGVGHEYWENGVMTRAEWCDAEGRMRPCDEVEKHIDAFFRIFDDIGFGERPSSFVPAAFRFGFGEGEGLAAVLKRRCIRFISTPFAGMRCVRSPETEHFGVDNGVMVVDRGKDLLPWNAIGKRPEGVIHGPIVGMHWPNLLHEDPSRNEETVDRWVDLLKPYGERIDRLLSRDTDSFASQLAFHAGTDVIEGDVVCFDFRRLDELFPRGMYDTFTVSVRIDRGRTFVAHGLTIRTVENLPGHTKIAVERQSDAAVATLSTL